MDNFSLLSEEEYKKLCSVIPHNFIVGYFQKNPKEFSKIRPGFRASALHNKNAIELLVIYRERGFISSFVERIANDWIKDIESVVQKYRSNGESEIVSYIHTLYQSFFSDNVSAYFKLIEKNYNEEQLEMISNMISLLKGIEEEQRELQSSFDEIKTELSTREKKIEKIEKALYKANKQLSDSTAKLNGLKSFQNKYHDLLSSYEQTIKEKDSSLMQIDSLTQQISLLNETVKNLKKEKTELEISIRAKLEEEKEAECLPKTSSVPLAPIDMDEFKEYLSYNLKSIEIVDTSLSLLTNYISNILFQGRPIICNKSYINTLVKCISNTLIGNAPVSTITFSPVIDEKKISAALSNSGRIVVLENFLGNYNETVLLSMLDNFKSKVIFLSTTYEKSLYYLPKDFLAYCNYINLSHIPSFLRSIEPDEDPSILEEKEVVHTEYQNKNRYRDIVSLITTELGYSVVLSEKVTECICDDISACAVLLFNSIPYMRDVLGKNSFNFSESLQRYVGRCSYKKVFEEWFMV